MQHRLSEKAADSGEAMVLGGLPRAQATPELLRWPQLIAVTDV
jgi:hypothetical protein